MTRETALVTGGAGFIGSVLCRALLGEDVRVVAYDNLSFGSVELLGPPHPLCTFVEGDVRDLGRVSSVLREFAPRTIFHLAALHFIPYCNAHPVEAMDVNVNGTRILLSACRAHPPATLLFTSTAAVYPAQPGRFSEASPPGPLDVYGYTKLMGEDLARLFALETGIPTRVARLFNAFGPNDTNPHLLPEIVSQLRQGTRTIRLGNLDPIRDYIHVRDVAAALLALAARKRAPFEVFNVGSGVGRSVRQVVDAFGAALGAPLSIVQDPERVRPVERLELVADADKLARETGWRPRVDFEEGLGEMLAGPPASPEDPRTTRG